jgi:hypothetical protein
VRDGDHFENYRYAPLITNVHVSDASPYEGGYRCEMGTLWDISFYALIFFFLLNAVGYFMEISMNYFWQCAYFLQIVTLIPLIKLYLPSCVSLYMKDMSIVNGENYWIFTNFLGNTFDNVSLEALDKVFWYGF